ncbi:MAG: aldo/keto reductase [Armatimonadetes bacterium]|nr:aldo/keto reductase [Armatimonadota bacterium]
MLETSTPRVRLGTRGPEVSRLCFGLGSSGCGSHSLQSRRPPEEIAAFLLEGISEGVTWWDTSDDYGTHRHIAHALRAVDRAAVQITTKTRAGTRRGARASLEKSLRELGTDYVDVFLMHEVDSHQDLEARGGALEALASLREDGLAGAVGLSTHAIEVLERVAGDPRLDVLLTNYNFAGVHMDADIRDYERALIRAFEAGQGVAVMKTLGEGVLADRLRETLSHNLAQPFIHAVLVGVKSRYEAAAAIAAWQGKAFEPANS